MKKHFRGMGRVVGSGASNFVYGVAIGTGVGLVVGGVSVAVKIIKEA